MKTALIFGISGQDGSYMARLLLKRGYRVVGTSRDAETQEFRNLNVLGIREAVSLKTLNPKVAADVERCLTDVAPDEIYDFSGQSSVSLSFTQPREAFDSIFGTTLNVLEAIRASGAKPKFYSSCSGDCYGDLDLPADEKTPFAPKSPYGVAKAAAHAAIGNYRSVYGLFACSGILFNHESPLRPENFVTQKVVRGACNIAAGRMKTLELGNLNIERDWGWAPEYVECVYAMMQTRVPDDFVIATGQVHTLQQFVEKTFSQVGLNWRDHVKTSDRYTRPSDVRRTVGNPSKARDVLGWKASVTLDKLIDRMIRAYKTEFKNLD